MKRPRLPLVSSLCVVIALGLLIPLRKQAFARAERSGDPLPSGSRNRALAPFMGKPVRLVVKSLQNALPEEGTLEAFDDGWLRLHARDGTIVCYNAESVFAVIRQGWQYHPETAK